MKKLYSTISENRSKSKKCKKLCKRCINKLQITSSTETSFVWCKTNTEDICN